MIYALNPDDTFILETILWYGPTLIPPIILAAYLSIKSPIKKAPEYLMIGTFISLLLFVSIELFHTSGYFLGKISESFITLQMRRGFWVATMFSLIIIIPNFKSLFNNISIKTFNFLAFVTAIIFLGMNQIVTPIVYFYMFYLAFTNTKDKVFIFLAIITILLVILSKQYGEWPLHHSNKYFIYFFGSCILYYFFLRMYKDFILSKVITLSVFTFISFGLAKGLYEGKLYKSSQILFNNTIFGKTNHKLMIKQHHKNNHLDLQMSDYFKNLPLLEKDGYYMTVPPSEITYADKAFYGISIYFSWVNLVSPIINRAQYNISYDKLVILYGKNVVDKYYDTFTNTKENFINYFDNEYNKISVNNLKKLYTNKKIRYYCSPFSRLDLYGTLIYKGSKHYLYDLSLIAGFKIK